MKLYIARDLSGALWLYEKKPYKLKTVFVGGAHDESRRFLDDTFPEVTFENSPQEVELVIKK